MKLFGSLKELVSAVFRKDSQEITLRPNQSTTYTAARDVQLPPGDSAHVIVSAASTQTLTNKTIDGDDNTVQDLPVTALKTVLADADKVLLRDGSGVPTSALLVNANVDAAAAIAATKLADGSVDNTEFQKLGTAGTNASGQLVTTDGTQLLQNKTIDGDENTVQDLPLTAIKAAIADADKVIRRDASGVMQSGNTIPNSSALVTTDATQSLSSKTLTNPVINTYTDINEAAAPGTPATGKVRLYAKTDGLLYAKDDAGVETSLGGGGVTASPTSQGVTTSYFPIIQSAVLSSSSATINVTTTDGYAQIRATSTSNQTINLPAAASNAGRRLIITKTADGGTVTIDPNSTETIGGASTQLLENEGSTITAICNGTDWDVVSNYTGGRSYIRVTGSNGFGSTNTSVRRYGTTEANVGSAITYADSAADGASFIINQRGIYAITVNDNFFNANSQLGITRNSSDLVNNVALRPASQLLAYQTQTGADVGTSLSWTGFLDVGDVIRVQGIASDSIGSVSDWMSFTMCQVTPVN